MADRIVVTIGDITTTVVDVIVNRANEALIAGGGVDGAIHCAAGPRLFAARRTIGICPTGEARLTRSYDLAARWVIHTVGPAWTGGGGDGADDRMACCYRNSLAPAEREGFGAHAFPAIGAGAYGFPLDRATRMAVREVDGHLRGPSSSPTVTLVCSDEEAYEECLDAVKDVGR